MEKILTSRHNGASSNRFADESSSASIKNFFIKSFPVQFLQIDNFVDLDDNWDGYGGIPVYPEVAKNAKKILRTLDPEYVRKITDIFPNPHGTVTIEWENNKGKFSLEIGKSSFSYFVDLNDGQPKGLNGTGLPDVKLIEANLFEVFRNEYTRILFVQ